MTDTHAIYKGRFSSNSDYKVAFKTAVDDLFSTGGTTPERMIATGALVDEYIAQTGDRPDAVQLDRLATFILLADKAEMDAMKQAAKIAKQQRLGAA